MGREATITHEQVAAAADALKSTGVSPTLRAVRQRLGDTGSMGTISKHLQTWKESQERETAAALILPPGLQRAILEFMRNELSAARLPLETDLAEQQQAAVDLASENERLLEKIQDLMVQIDGLVAGKASAEGKAQQLAADLDGAKAEAARERNAAEASRTELTKTTLRLEALPRVEADLAATRADLAAECQSRIGAEQRAAVLEAQKIDLDSRLKDKKIELQQANEQLETVRARTEQLAKNLADALMQRIKD